MAGLNSDTLSELLAELTQLGREATVLDERLRAAHDAAAETSGRDPSEQVQVLLTATGQIKTVGVAPGWRSRLDVGELGGAVLAAYRQAAGRRIEMWAAEVNETGADTAPTLDNSEPQSAPAIGAETAPPEQAAGDSIRDLWYLLQDATDRLGGLAQETAARSQAVTTGQDSHGRVTATLTGGELTGVRLNGPWAVRTSGRDIGTAITAAVTNGYATIDALAERSLTRQWPFPDLERFTANPTALLTALGLPVPRSEPQR